MIVILSERANCQKVNGKNLSLAVGQLAEAPIYLDDSAGMSVLEVRAKARRLKAEKDIGLIIVDYLQLTQGLKGLKADSKKFLKSPAP